MDREPVRILLVEDEEAHAEAVRRAFEPSGAGVNLTWAPNIRLALSYLKEATPDLVITDWLLPDGKGTDILLTHHQNRHFPVVLMTSQGNEQVAVDAMKAGALDYVVKSPVMFADMPHIADRAIREWDALAEQRRTEEKLRESEERFRTIFEQGPLGMHIAGVDYRFVAANPAFCRIVGYSREELSRLTFVAITHPEDLETDIAQARKLLEGEMPFYKLEKRYVTKTGEVVWIDCTRSIVRSADGSPLYFLTMVEDITERREAEEKLKQTLADLTRSNDDLQQFAYVASHDLQEPLRNVVTCLQMLEKKHKCELNPDACKYITYAVESAARMKDLILDLLAYSRVATKGKSPKPTNCELILNQTVSNLRSAITETKAVITSDPLPTVPADDTQLFQIFQNLLHNAIKFRRDEPPRVHVSAVKNDNEWIFSVKDNGIGIESEHLDRIFVIFQRLHGMNEYEGTGMGLAIVKKVVERHHGRIWVESGPGRGTTFYFTIPDKIKR
jgi:PAS domain S-box-containing protein